MEETTPKQAIRFVQAENLPSIYANSARVLLSYNDVKIYFSETSPEPGTQMLLTPGEISTNPNAMAIERICMILSPEFARSLYEVLGTSVEKYEEKFGKLRPKPVQT